MKSKQLLSILGFALICLAGPSCKKLVEVSPKTQIEDLDFFSNEQGFKEALNGIYLQLGRTSQYGRELTFGFTDVLGGMYVLSTSNGSQTYRDAFAGLYTGAGPQTIKDGIWADQYNSIANLNKLINQLENADTLMFKTNNFRVISGEAYGLRAFLHFDLLRLFGTSYANNGADLAAIPYVKEYAPKVTGKSTSREVINMILADITKAADYLKADPIYTGQTITSDIDNGYLLNRNLHFNYYAVKGLEARVQLWAGEPTKALPAAEEIIAVAPVKFPWILQSSIASSNEAARDRVFTTEHLFGLAVNNLATNYVDLLDTTRFTSTLVVTAARLTEQFETGTVGAADYRRVYLIRELTNIASPKIFFGKLYQPTGMTVAFSKKMPLMRIPEIYYIAAECLKESNPEKAIGYLNAVRTSRGITSTLPTTYTAAQIQTEIRKEYWKEFPLEGQFFFYNKRVNSAAIPGVTGSYPLARYVLPLPPAELEYGF